MNNATICLLIRQAFGGQMELLCMIATDDQTCMFERHKLQFSKVLCVQHNICTLNATLLLFSRCTLFIYMYTYILNTVAATRDCC